MFVSKLQVLARGGALLAAVTFAIVFFYVFAPIPDPLFPNDYSTIVKDRSGETLRVYLNGDEQWIFPPDPDAPIPERLRRTVIAFEDRFFYQHPGINPGAIMRAIYQNLTAGRRVSGASTITMQLARIMEAKPRTVASKLLESVQAVAIEMRYTKDEILRLYLDHAPYGGNIRGFRAAAGKYFGKDPYDLTWAEAATLAVLPNAPRFAPAAAGPEALASRRDELLGRLHAADVIPEDDYELALAEPVPSEARIFPVAAPHAADFARSRADGFQVSTTIDIGLQRELESMVAFHARYLAGEGVANVLALVADTRTGETVAYVGSQDYFDYSVQGHIDGVQSPRSTGSILKPFLYALAMDEGMIAPASALKDVPTQIGAYSPQNIDRSYRGLVSAEEALVRSLNVPAVRLLQEYGLESFYYFLGDAGLSSLFRRPEDYGLPLILGGAEASPWEIAGLYRGLAAGGVFGPLRILGPAGRPGDPSPAASGDVRLLSDGAAFLTLKMLQEVRRPGAEAYWRAFEGGVPVAWKTGTSYGRRDAWAVGVSPQWTVVVWAGNFTGASSPNLTSTAGAGYLLFEIFNAFPDRLPVGNAPGSEGRPEANGSPEEGGGFSGTGGLSSPSGRWFDPPPGSLREVEVCLSTGYRATEHCPETAVSVVPAGAPPMPACPYHETIYVTTDGAYRVDSRCWEPGEYRSRSALVLPADVAAHIRSAGLEPTRMPPWAPGCGAPASTSRLSISYPSDGARIFLPRELGGSLQRLTVRAAHQDPDATLYWYVNTRYVGSTGGGIRADSHKLSLALERGRYTLTCVDESGARASVRFVVDVEEPS